MGVWGDGRGGAWEQECMGQRTLDAITWTLELIVRLEVDNWVN